MGMSGRVGPMDRPEDEDPDGSTPASIGEPMPCPWGHCAAVAPPLVHRTDPKDATKIAIVYPMHDVIGPNSWFGRCPASQLIVAPALSAAGEQVLRDANAQFLRRFSERINRAHYEASEQLGPEATDEALAELVREQLRRRPAPPEPDDYFPGRPADAPEPGVGEEPAVKLPLDQIGYPQGKALAMSTRETHLAMIAAVRASIGEAQEKLAMAIAATEDLEAAVTLLPPSVTAAHGLVHATVGAGTDLPEPAIAMRADITAALDTVTGEGSLAQAVGLVRARVGALAGQLAAASQHAETYAAMPK